ncbi:MAG: hypothetical protein E6J44_01165 [Chloroflexi bacterium]|nr:MAG: hypothetical protein E6J44_01165 [Chloroflexota bacterium]
MISPPGTQSLPLPSRTSIVLIPRRWLILARVAWVVCALLLLTNFVASIPAYYRIMLTICTLPNQVPCTMPGNGAPSGQLTPVNVHALAQLHLSVATYAAYYVTLQVVLSSLYLGVGLLIFWRKSDVGMGLFVSLWLVLYGASSVTNNFLFAYAPTQPPLILLALISGVQWAGLGAFLLTFPTGRFVPRWSWLLGSALGIIIYRYVRVFDAVQRQQTKWFIYAFAVGMFLGAISTALLVEVPADSPYQLLNGTTTLLFFVFIPLGLGIAILRYRLWDIDAIINRTLVYGSLTVLLVGLYIGLILALQALVRAVTGSLSQQPPVLVGSTLVIAALFQPLRRLLQTIIDRRFYRRKYDAAKVMAAFGTTLRTEVDVGTLREQLLAIVQETMQPAHVSLWIRPAQQGGKHETAWTGNPPPHMGNEV